MRCCYIGKHLREGEPVLKKALSCLILLSLVACEKSSDTVVKIPNVRVGCTTSDDANCSSANIHSVTAFVRMTRSGCGSSIGYDPVATGSVIMSCDGSGCDGTVNSWVNPETSSGVNEILTGVMDVCAQVDLNASSGLPDSGDLINESSTNITSESTITIDSWSAY